MDLVQAFREKARVEVESEEEEKELVSFDQIPKSDNLLDLEIGTLLNE